MTVQSKGAADDDHLPISQRVARRNLSPRPDFRPRQRPASRLRVEGGCEMNLADFKALVERNGPVVRDGSDWRGRCPAHSDNGRRGDLTFREGDDGRIVLHCWGGCTAPNVVAALGLKWSDLFSENGHGRPQKPQRPAKPRKVYPLIQQAVDAIAARLGGEYAGDWTYRDANGEAVLYVARFDDCATLGGRKAYRPIHPVPGGYVEGDPPGPLPLYNLPRLLANTAGPVFIVEGEKASDMGAKIGLLCTTSAHGAQSPAKTDWTTLAGRDCILLPDRDPAGERYADTVAQILASLNPPAKVKIVRLPDLPEGGDLYDYVEQSEAEDTETIRARVLSLAAEAKLLPAQSSRSSPKEPSPPATNSEVGLMITNMGDVEPETPEWLWPNRYVANAVNILSGDPGSGKTFLCCHMAAAVTRGAPWPDGTGTAPRGSVLIVSSEDPPGILRKRLDDHGADPQKVSILTGVRDGQQRKGFDLNQHLQALERVLDAMPDLRLLILDPITAYMGKTNSNSNAEVRVTLDPVTELAARRKITIMGVNHHNKRQDLNYIYRGLGSMGFVGVARSSWAVVVDKEDPDVCILAPVKTNYSVKPTGLRYRLIDGVVTFEPGVWAGKLDDQVQQPRNSKLRIEECAAWLKDRLSSGAVLSASIFEEAKEQGFNKDLCFRAKERLGVQCKKAGFKAGWFWTLPGAGDEDGY